MNKVVNQLEENKLSDGTNLVFCTKWNASLGARSISTFGDDLYITPASPGFHSVKVEKSKKIQKSEISEIKVIENFWTGNKVTILLADGKKLKYALVNKSAVEPAKRLAEWFNSGLNSALDEAAAVESPSPQVSSGEEKAEETTDKE